MSTTQWRTGDRVLFWVGSHQDTGELIARDGEKFDRPWRVRWTSGVETYPCARYLTAMQRTVQPGAVGE